MSHSGVNDRGETGSYRWICAWFYSPGPRVWDPDARCYVGSYKWILRRLLRPARPDPPRRRRGRA